MTKLVDLNLRRAPVVYNVTIAHHYDGKLEFLIEDVGDDERSREAVFHAFRRISGAEDRIEKLEAALREIDAVKYYGMEGAEMECREMHEIARKALEGKDD